MGIIENNAGIINSSTQYGDQKANKQKHTVATCNAKSVFLTYTSLP